MTSQNQVDTDKMRRAYQQLFNGSQTLLEIKSTSWIDKVLLKRIHDQYGRKLEQVGDPLPLDTGIVGGDRISFGSFSGGTVAIGQGAIAVGSQGNDQRNEQYEIAKNWDGERLMRGFDLSERDLSGLNLVNADLRKANLKGADLSKTNLIDEQLE